MSHSDLILIIIILTVSSTAGVYVLVTKINQCTRAPENHLIRRGDIELNNLNDFIEPTQPLQVYFPRQLDELSSYPPSYNIESFTGNAVPVIGFVPSHRAELYYVNCCLENENIINSVFIIIVLILFIIIIYFLLNYKSRL